MSEEPVLMDITATSGIEPEKHVVVNPKRAVKKFAGEAVLKGLGGIINMLGISIIGVFFLGIAGDSETLGTIGMIVFWVGVFVFMINMGHAKKSWEMTKGGLATPDRGSPESTVKVFFSCLYDYGGSKLWKRAYNCLTDTAQSTAGLTMPRSDYLKKKMVDPKITSVDEFSSWWEQTASAFGFEFRVDVNSITTLKSSEDIAVLRIPIILTWREKDDILEENVQWTIPLVKRESYWFLTAGYFWPTGKKFPDLNNHVESE